MVLCFINLWLYYRHFLCILCCLVTRKDIGKILSNKPHKRIQAYTVLVFIEMPHPLQPIAIRRDVINKVVKSMNPFYYQ